MAHSGRESTNRLQRDEGWFCSEGTILHLKVRMTQKRLAPYQRMQPVDELIPILPRVYWSDPILKKTRRRRRRLGSRDMIRLIPVWTIATDPEGIERTENKRCTDRKGDSKKPKQTMHSHDEKRRLKRLKRIELMPIENWFDTSLQDWSRPQPNTGRDDDQVLETEPESAENSGSTVY